MYLGENNGNLSETKKMFPIPNHFSKWQNFDMRKEFLIMSNFYLVEILSEPNSRTIVTSKKYSKGAIMCSFWVYFFSHNENQEIAVRI